MFFFWEVKIIENNESAISETWTKWIYMINSQVYDDSRLLYDVFNSCGYRCQLWLDWLMFAVDE